ncbi:MAG: VanZ family protein [Gammaproteobacteria bacterium]
MNRINHICDLNRTPRLNLALLTFYCGFIFWLSGQPSVSMPMAFPYQDKLFHAAAYFIMGVLAWRTGRPLFSRPALAAFFFCSLFGLSDEWHQSFVEGRFAELSDWLADTAGTGAGLLFCKKFFG